MKLKGSYITTFYYFTVPNFYTIISSPISTLRLKFIILNTCEISEKEYNKFKGYFK
jgi:hypothetical protein